MDAREASLLAWGNTFTEAETDISAFADGTVLLCVAQDTMEGGFDFGGAAADLSGLLQSLEHAYEVRRPPRARARGAQQRAPFTRTCPFPPPLPPPFPLAARVARR